MLLELVVVLLTKVNVAKTGRSFDDDDDGSLLLLLVDVVPLPVVVELKMERSRVWEENMVVVLVSWWRRWCVSFFVLFFSIVPKTNFSISSVSETKRRCGAAVYAIISPISQEER